MDLSTAYWQAQAFLTANRLGLFALLDDGPAAAGAVASRLGTEARGTELLLKALTALGLVTADDGRYANSELSAAFLVPGRPGFMGNAVLYSDNLYDTWGRLEDSLRSGRPAMAPSTYLGDDDKTTRDFVYGMHDRALGIGRALVEMVDLGGRAQMLDVGGGPGTYSALFTARNPGLKSRVLDLPHVVAIAEEILESMDAADRVGVLPGDYQTTPFPAGNDVVMISGVFHRERPQTCRSFIERARDALVPGGMLIVSDVFADAGGTGPVFATLFGLNMMLTAPDGGVHADADVAGWMRDAGFSDVQASAFPPPMPHRLVTGTLP